MDLSPETWQRAPEVLDEARTAMVSRRYALRPAGEP